MGITVLVGPNAVVEASCFGIIGNVWSKYRSQKTRNNQAGCGFAKAIVKDPICGMLVSLWSTVWFLYVVHIVEMVRGPGKRETGHAGADRAEIWEIDRNRKIVHEAGLLGMQMRLR
jgi:hypothetical protein